MHSGGFVWIELLMTIVYSPWSRKYLPIAFISSDVPLNGVIGVHGSRRPDEIQDAEQPEVPVRPDRRVLRGQPLVVLAHPRPSRAALSMRPSSSYTRIVARAAASETGCDEYVSPP